MPHARAAGAPCLHGHLALRQAGAEEPDRHHGLGDRLRRVAGHPEQIDRRLIDGPGGHGHRRRVGHQDRHATEEGLLDLGAVRPTHALHAEAGRRVGAALNRQVERVPQNGRVDMHAAIIGGAHQERVAAHEHDRARNKTRVECPACPR